MADKIIHKKNFIEGVTPTTSSLQVAEIAINVADGKVYVRRSSSLQDDIVPLVSANTITTGSITATSFTGSFTGSFAGDGTALYIDTGSLLYSASFNAFTASYELDSSSFDNRIIANSSSINILTNDFNLLSGSYVIDSASFDNRIIVNSSSINVLTNDFNSFTASYELDSSSFDNRITTNTNNIADLTSKTGSYATTGSNIFYGNQTINGNITVNGTASVALLHTLYQTSSIIFQSGSTKFGDTFDDTHQFTGSVNITSSLRVTGSFTATGSVRLNNLTYPTQDNGEESFIQTDGAGTLTLQYVKTIYEEIVNGEATQLVKGTPVYVSGSQGASAIVYRADAANPAKMPVIYIAADTLASGQQGRGIALGLIKGVNTTGYPAGTEIYVAPGGGWTSVRPTGSAIVQTLGYVTKEGNGGQGVVLNPGPNNLPNLTSGSIWVGDSNSVPITVPTSSLTVATASYYAETDPVFTAVSGTFVTTSSFNAFTSSYTTGSFTGSFIGDGSQLTGIVSSKWSGSNPITRESDVEITGSLRITGSLNVTGSTITTSLTASRAIISSVGSGTFKVQGSGSSEPIFLVTGSIGELISVSDTDDPSAPLLVISGSSGQVFVVENSATGSLLQIYNTSSNLIFEVTDQSQIIYGGISSSILTTHYTTIPVTESYQYIYNIITSSFSGAFIHYTIISGSNARAGQLMSIWNNGVVSYNETTTTDIGDTSQIKFNVIMSESIAQIAVSSSLTTNWQVKTILNIL